MKAMKGLAVLAVLAGCVWAAGLARAADAKGGDAKDFATKASAAGLAEVNLSNLAAVKATNPAVKEFAVHMATEHTKLNRQLVGLANRKSLRLARTMDEKHRKLEQKLNTLKGADFDRAYMDAMLKDHEAAVKLFENESKNGKDAALKEWAGKSLPGLREHLKMARDVHKKVKGKGKD